MTRRRRTNGWAAVATVLLLAGALVACGATAPTPLPTPGPALFPDEADRAAAAALTRERRMSWGPAGPHHVLGVAPDGTQLDVVGHPPAEVVASVPAWGSAADPAASLDAYLGAIAELMGIGAPPLRGWVAERTAGWVRSTGLRASGALEGVTVELRTIGDPAYLRLRLVRD